ncbi:CDP-glycerol glycerophosphotransferase family protein [Thalassotalea mangrovi]|uniref:CDP-glycerol--poly(Glycerophosphate) glycerophosphotransferase n=1 Tax=Thalassotalea mangrovi TaxID=2572245 RepID=A0A4U1BAL4_9GAMM|nr:CDP-glycerol glycerophosphotransferase family protein [Thalassotalea mangrovi]TKB47187.1 CDP-glycerol--poly(glycerophosphate) glycerophosphotransferase [Thalassotalea mangrovi]
MYVLFDVLHLYYLPQYLPVQKKLADQGVTTAFVFYHSTHDHIMEQIASENGLQYIWVENDKEAASYYQQQKADWVFFANSFAYLDDLHQVSKSAQIGHGIGPKSCYYTASDTAMTVRFVEGAYRCERLRSLYPESTFIDVGFSKLDPLFSDEEPGFDMAQLGLDPNKPTLTYAPTFYPSSIECFDKNWPADFNDFNILLKPHYFSIAKEKYHRQKALLEHWASFDNVYLAKETDYNLVPFMASSDILISDASSALFEFAALNKPVIWCDFLKLRWSYRGLFSYRFKKRMDEDFGEYANIAVHAKTYKELRNLVIEQYQQPQLLAPIRAQLAEKLAGRLDGKASERVVAYLMNNAKFIIDPQYENLR